MFIRVALRKSISGIRRIPAEIRLGNSGFGNSARTRLPCSKLRHSQTSNTHLPHKHIITPKLKIDSLNTKYLTSHVMNAFGLLVFWSTVQEPGIRNCFSANFLRGKFLYMKALQVMELELEIALAQII